MRRSLVTALFVLAFTTVSFAREAVSLDQDWQFIKQDAKGAEVPAFDDSSWTKVSLPHTWNAQDAGGGSTSYYRGPGWYRRHVTLSDAQAGQTVYLWFGACGSAAEAFVNGKSAGAHKGAFGSFDFDVTGLVHPGDNVIAVRATNEADKSITPLEGDFNVCGGLYRNAKLLILDKLAISPLDHGSSGVFIKQTKITDDRAILDVTTLLRNSNSAAKSNATVRVTIGNSSGENGDSFAPLQQSGATSTVTQTVQPDSTTPVINQIIIDKPHLWNGRADPFMYTVRVEVLDGQNVTDQLDTPTGLRYFSVDPAKGFFLNGKYLDLHGVCRHQDFYGKAWGITPDEIRGDVSLMEELGATTVRLAHYEHSPVIYDECDKSGIVVWAENCMVNKVDQSQEFYDVTSNSLAELIKQNYNHPSICFWSLYNELDGSGKDPELLIVSRLNALAHELDPTRLTVAASNKAVTTNTVWVTDVIAFNHYDGWYGGTPQSWPKYLDDLHKAAPNRAIGISEYGAGASAFQHQENPKTHSPTTSHWHDEEWQNIVHEQAWQALSQRPWIWGKFLWVLADFSVDHRTEGDRDGINDKGLVTQDRKIKKDAFYFYKASWSTEPTVHITEARYTPRPQQTIDVKIYSNCDTVELKVNGTSLGKQASPDVIHLFEKVKLNHGPNELVAIGEKDGKAVSDAATIVSDPAAPTSQSTTRP